jgi:hypothetical protein
MASDRAKAELAAAVELGLTEPVVYRPLANGTPGATRTPQAVVERLGPQAALAGIAAKFRVAILNDAALGVTAAEVDRGQDRLDVAERFGGTAAGRSIVDIDGERTDADWLVLLLQ